MHVALLTALASMAAALPVHNGEQVALEREVTVPAELHVILDAKQKDEPLKQLYWPPDDFWIKEGENKAAEPARRQLYWPPDDFWIKEGENKAAEPARRQLYWPPDDFWIKEEGQAKQMARGGQGGGREGYWMADKEMHDEHKHHMHLMDKELKAKKV